MIDFSAPAIDDLPAGRPELVLECRNATCSGASLEPNEATGGWRVRFDLRPRADDAVELRCLLTQDSRQISETWLYRVDGA